MSGGADPAAAAFAQLRELVPRVLGAAARRCGDFDVAEDAVQEALLEAAKGWPTTGPPDNPGGWLLHVALRRIADRRREDAARRRREGDVAVSADAAVEPPAADDADGFGGDDDALALLFTCCHPVLPSASAIALVLRAVGGLTTAEIARAFLVPEPTMAQRIRRAKQAIGESGVPFAVPSPAERPARLGTVLHVLYLIFNEGYASSSGPDLVRTDLSNEAIRLARLVCRLAPEHDEARGLLALMLLTDARRRARTGPLGELVPLHEQDRSRWDRDAIAEGSALIAATIARGNVGGYQLQAAIAALHDEAETFAATDWPQILALYGLLARMGDNPMVRLNLAVAAAMVHGPRHGLERLAALDQDARLAASHRLDAVRAHLHEMAGERDVAIAHYRRAAARTASAAERDYLLAKAARLQHP